MAKKLKNRQYVLSIDIDYILEPFINYVELAWSNRPSYVTIHKDIIDKPTSLVDRMHDLGPLIKDASSISQINFKECVEIFSEALFALTKKDMDKVYFADNHDTILTHLQNHYSKIGQYEKNETKYTIINFDHHHDIYYSKEQARDVDLYNIVSPGDWVWYLDKNNLCDEYHWIGNKNSSNWRDVCGSGPPELMQNGGRYTSLQEFRDAYTLPKKFDLIYVCKSPHWTPDIYFDYFDILKDMAEKYFKTSFEQDIGYYCGSRTSRNFFEGPAKDSIILDEHLVEDNGDPIKEALLNGNINPEQENDN